MSSKEIHRYLLRRVVELSQNPGQRLFAVFDLDSTLFDVCHRSQTILQEFAADPAMQGRFPDLCHHLQTVEVVQRDWGIRSALERQAIPVTEDFVSAIKEFWTQHFFSNRWLVVDRPYPGAVEFVNSLAGSGAEVLYLTGRDRPRMGRGTIQSLRQHGFPLHDEDVQLVMKPIAGLDDAEFKAAVLRELLPHHHEVWFFENEPVILNRAKRELPQLRLVFIDSVHSGREEPPTDVPVIAMHYEMG